MRYLKRQNLNRRVANDTTLYSDTANANVYIAPHLQGSVVLPNGPTSAQPADAVSGMMRYDTTTDQVMVYQGSTWRALRFKESTGITQQTLGVGDGDTVYFGPLNPEPPAIVQNNESWGGQNLLVVVENVLQLHVTNYTIEQNPTFAAETYHGTLSRTELVTATRLYFNTSLQVTGASGNSTTATLTFTTQPAVPFSIGETILVTGLTPYAYNGSFTVTACTESSVSYVSTATGALTVEGSVTSSHTIYPAVDIIGATITGTNIPGGTTVTDFDTDALTGALLYVDISNPIAGSPINAGTAITIAESTQAGNGYYLLFSSPVPPGKTVTVLHGFDQ